MFVKCLLEELNRVACFQWHITFLLLLVVRWQAASRLVSHRHSSEMRALGLDVNGVEGLAGGHEQTVAFFAPKTNVRADFRQQNHPDSTAFRRKYVHAVVAVTHPARRGPEVAIEVAADAVGAAVAAYGPRADFCFDVLLRHSHVCKAALVL